MNHPLVLVEARITDKAGVFYRRIGVPRGRLRTANKLNLTAKDAKNAKFSSSKKASPATCILMRPSMARTLIGAR